MFPSPRGPLARVIKRDVITRHGAPLQLQPPHNSTSIRQRSRQRGGERERSRRKKWQEKWIKERRRYRAGEKGDKEDGKRAAAVSKKKRARGGKGEGDRKRKEGNSGWTGTDLSWLDIRRTSMP